MKIFEYGIIKKNSCNCLSDIRNKINNFYKDEYIITANIDEKTLLRTVELISMKDSEKHCLAIPINYFYCPICGKKLDN